MQGDGGNVEYGMDGLTFAHLDGVKSSWNTNGIVHVR